jgi:hypothetical protein
MIVVRLLPYIHRIGTDLSVLSGPALERRSKIIAIITAPR